MLSRSWLGALGLRGQIVGAVVVTAVTMLVVAAIALLPRLETSLRKSAQTTLSTELSRPAILDPIRTLDLRVAAAQDLPAGVPADPGYHEAQQEILALSTAETTLKGEVGATSVILIGYIDASGHGSPVLESDRDEQKFEDPGAVATAWLSRSGKPIPGIITISGTSYALEAIPFHSSDSVLFVSAPINEIPGAVHTVQVAFLLAALAGLVLTFLLAIPLSATLVRRLQRLRESALALAADGAVADVPVDRARDEVGDLARTFALMQERLRHQEAARRAFVATASHELRTPLTSLDLMLELLAEDLRSGAVDRAEALELLERARGQTKRLGRLAADLLDLSRIDADVALRSEPVELGELSRAVVAEFELGTQERGVSCVLREREGPVWALGDPGAIARILRILLDNALRVAPVGTEIEVILCSRSSPELSVLDHGPGVPDEEREMIFDRFKRGRGTGGEAGFGLGLAIGRELAERMSGTLMLAETQEPGATFTLSLPFAQAPVEDRVASAANA